MRRLVCKTCGTEFIPIDQDDVREFVREHPNHDIAWKITDDAS